MAQNNIIAAFDFDGTITSKDTFIEFIRHCFGNARFSFGMLILSPIILLYKLGLLRNDIAKGIVFSFFFKGMKKQRFISYCNSFKNEINGMIKPEAQKKINYHLDENHYLIIVSASMEDWIRPWAMDNEFNSIIGTKLDFNENKISGKFASPNCYGLQKEIRLRKHIPNIDQCILYAYGDSAGDQHLLAMADYPFFRDYGL